MNSIFFPLLLLILFLSSCTQVSSFSKSTDILRIDTGYPIGEIKPYIGYGIGANLSDLVYYPLFRINPNGKVQNVLSEKIEWKNDYKQLDIFLKDPIAEDVKETFERAKSPDSPFFQSLENLKSIIVHSPTYLTFNFIKYDRLLLLQLDQVSIIANSQEDNTTGEFLVAEKKEDFILLKRKKESKDKINYIQLEYIPSSRLALRRLASGKTDLLIYPGQGSYEIINDLPEFKIAKLSFNLLIILLENQRNLEKKFKFNWLEISRNLDRAKFANTSSEFLIPTTSPVIQSSPWWDQSLEKTRSQNSVTDIHNYEFFKGRKISYYGLQEYRMLARILKRRIEEVGIPISLLEIPQKDFGTEIMEKHNFDLLLLFVSFKDMMVSNYHLWHQDGAYNYAGYNNNLVSQKLDEAREVQNFDQAKRAFIEAINEMMSAPPGLFLFWINHFVVLRNSCSGMSFNSTEFFTSLKDVRCTL